MADADVRHAADAAERAEAARQRALLDALATHSGGACGAYAALASHRPDAGLRAYRANAHAAAERALAVTFPTLRALVGADAFAQLAREFWHAHPPLRGDLGEWGGALPGWTDAHDRLRAWPYLGDCARLDLALHECERAADAAPETATLALLANDDPRRVRLRLLPCVRCVASRWPVATLHAAHREGGDALFETARELIHAGSGESVVVARAGWRGVVHRIDAAGLAFVQALLRDADLSRALDAAGEGFDFAAWLADALRKDWLLRVERCAEA